MPQAILRTVPAQVVPIGDPTREIPVIVTSGSLDVTLQLDHEAESALGAHPIGTRVVFSATVTGGNHLTPGTKTA